MKWLESFRRVVFVVAVLNFAYFCVEIIAAYQIGSVSLFADAIDFLEDAAVNFLIVAAVGWSPLARERLGRVLAVILFIPGLLALGTVINKLVVPTPPEPFSLSLVGSGALLVNFSCALMLARFRTHTGGLVRAAFLSARNDAIANIAIVAAGFLTALTLSIWPDLIVGLGILALNVDAARQVWRAAHQTDLDARLTPAED
ncbi:MAG: cation transporter [Anaerolineae bacterium]